MLFSEINKLQTEIMVSMKRRAKQEDKPIPRKYIITEIRRLGIGEPTIINAINSLLKKGYIRRAYSQKANTSLFVMIRNI